MSFDFPEPSSASAKSSSHNLPSPIPSFPPAKMTLTNIETATNVPTSPSDTATLPVSTSAPQGQGIRTLDATSVPFSPSLDSGLVQSSRSSSAEVLPVPSTLEANGSGTTSPLEPDPLIFEALRSKDRLWVLKLGEMMESLINDRRERIDLNPSSSYQRLLVHRCSAYYRLTPEADTTTKSIIIYSRTDSKIPLRRLCELVPAEEFTQPAPAFKIMRREPQDRRMRQNSQPGSVAGDDADVSDLDPSETSSVGGRSSATGSTKRHPTIEEREAAYNEARSRIFMDFEEKEKEKDASANSSTLSLVSGSAGRSSAGDGDDAASNAATESEYSSSVTRERSQGRRGGSSRSYRSSQGSYNPSASSSSRNSRATSPSFTYPSLYDPSANTYEPAYGTQGPAQPYVPYYYPPPPYPPQGAAQPYLSPYPYPYPSYGYSPPHQPSPHHSEPVSPNNEPAYAPSQSPPQMPFPPGPYMWPPPPHGPPVPQATSPTNAPTTLPGPPPPQSPPHQLPAQGMYYPPGYAQPYPLHAYYPPPPSNYPPAPVQPVPPPHMQGQFYPNGQPPQDTRFNNGNGVDGMNHSRTSSRNSNGQGSNSGRRGPAPQRRAPWSYGPGPTTGGVPTNQTAISDNIGPRLGSRRTSNASQSATGSRTPGDEASSVTSSTSSSSRRTMTSTSSKHPLPPRPDWAVGLRAQPTLSGPRHHDHSSSNSRTMSPARPPGHLPNVPYQMQPSQRNQPVLQATDFPPLSSAPEKKTPLIGGAWTNSSNMRSALRAGPSSAPAASGTQPNLARSDELEHAAEDLVAEGMEIPDNGEDFRPSASVENGAGQMTDSTTVGAITDRLGDISLNAKLPGGVLALDAPSAIADP